MASTDPHEPEGQSLGQPPEQPFPTVIPESAEVIQPSAGSMNYKCEFCEQQFKRKDRLDRHLYTHTGVLAYLCPNHNCDKAYSNRSHLNRHIRTAHMDNRQEKTNTLECKHPTCDKKFANKQSMDRHYHIKHMLGKPYGCDECDERFWRKMQLSRHKVKHTGQYPHKCEHCSQGFINRNAMDRHRCKHNAHPCPDCGKELKYWSELVAHRRLHHPRVYRCTECSKQFNSKSNLRMHVSRHVPDDEKLMYECPYEGCARYYQDKKNLYAHVRSKHESLKKYVCTEAECKAELSSQHGLDYHMKLHRIAGKTARLRMKAPAHTETKEAEKQAEQDREMVKQSTGEQSKMEEEKQQNLDSTSESEIECTLRVTNILESNLNSLKKQIDALRTDSSII